MKFSEGGGKETEIVMNNVMLLQFVYDQEPSLDLVSEELILFK
tara:strand:- start:356 stop:484 length:129 start_codon:yes stop_codon:yes gene_type:complete